MDQAIKSLQDYLKTSPLGVKYTGASDGYFSPAFKTAIDSLTSIIKDKLSKSSNSENQNKAKTFSILSGEKVVTSIDIIKKIVEDLQKESIPNPNIKAAQDIFNSNPFGINYSGPKDGTMNNEFSSKLKELENKIVEVTGAQVLGKLISGETLSTDANDMSKTFSLIKSYQDFIKTKK